MGWLSASRGGGAAQAALTAILTLTEQMLQTAREEDWLAVADQEARRRQLLVAVFAAPEAFDTLGLEAMIRQVLETDRAILDLAQAGRRAIGQQLELLQQGRRATTAYRSTAG